MISSDSTSIQDDVSTLPALFKEGLDLFNNLGRTDEPTNSLDVQCNVKRCIRIFERSTILCSYANIFSNNEGIEEVATSDLQYFLLPALLGSLHLKLTSGERRNIVEVSEVYFTDFMKRCVEYSLCKFKFKEELKEKGSEENENKRSLSEIEELTVLARRRAVKIGRYREQQELKKRLSELKNNMENEHADEEIKRRYFITMIQLYIHEAIDELTSVELEKLLLDHMAKLKKNERPKPKKRPPAPLRPVIITKDILQNNVYDVGYSSISTMSVEEFYNKRVKDGIFPNPIRLRNNFMSLQEAGLRAPPPDAEEQSNVVDNEIDTDDYHILEAMLQRDALKHSHCSGCGNGTNES